MATRDEIADAIAGIGALRGPGRPQLMGVASRFEEAFFQQGDQVLRQGLTGSGFYVILDGEADVVVDGTERARLGRGEFFGEVSSCSASRRSPTSSRPDRCAASSSAGRTSRASWSTIRGSCTGCSRPRPAGCAARTDGGAE